MPLPPVIDSNVFEGCGDLSGITCYIPKGSLVFYQKMDVWKEFNLIESDHMDESAIENTSTDASYSAPKVIRDNQVLIMRGGKTYTIQGVEVK